MDLVSSTARQVTRRKRLTASLLSWALTLASLAATVSVTLLVVASPDEIAATMADNPQTRVAAAAWVTDVLQATTGDAVLLPPAELAERFDTDALAALLAGTLEDVFDPGSAPDVPVSQLLPDVPDADLGLPDDADVSLLPVLPDLSLVPGLLRLFAAVAGFAAVVAALGAFAAAFPHQRAYVAARLGRWLLVASAVVTAGSAAIAAFAAGSGLGGAYASASASVVAAQLTVVLIIGFAAAAALLGTAGLLRAAHRRSVDSAVADAEPTLPAAAPAPADDPAGAVDRDVAPQPQQPAPLSAWPTLPPQPQDPSAAPATTGGPVETPFWARPGWPLPIDPFRESEITRDLSAADLDMVVRASVRAWVAGRDADADDAEILTLVLQDRENFTQVARLWARFDGLPRAAANVILAYTDLTLHVQEYAGLLGVPDWAVTNRVGTLRRGVQELGVPGFAAGLRSVYLEMADRLADAPAAPERTRLRGIADALAFAEPATGTRR